MTARLYRSIVPTHSDPATDSRPGQVDVWSLGMLLYEMVARKIPYHGMSPGGAALQLQQAVLPLCVFMRDFIDFPHPVTVAAAVAVLSQRVLPPLPASTPDWVRACCRYSHYTPETNGQYVRVCVLDHRIHSCAQPLLGIRRPAPPHIQRAARVPQRHHSSGFASPRTLPVAAPQTQSQTTPSFTSNASVCHTMNQTISYAQQATRVDASDSSSSAPASTVRARCSRPSASEASAC